MEAKPINLIELWKLKLFYSELGFYSGILSVKEGNDTDTGKLLEYIKTQLNKQDLDPNVREKLWGAFNGHNDKNLFISKIIKSEIAKADLSLSKVENGTEKAEGALLGIIEREESEDVYLEAYTYLLKRGFRVEKQSTNIINKFKEIQKRQKWHPDMPRFWASLDNQGFDSDLTYSRFFDANNNKEFQNVFDFIADDTKAFLISNYQESPFSTSYDICHICRSTSFADYLQGYTNELFKYFLKDQAAPGYWEFRPVGINKKTIKSIVETANLSFSLITRGETEATVNAAVKGARWLLGQQNINGSWDNEITGKEDLFTTCIAALAIKLTGVDRDGSALLKTKEYLLLNQDKTGIWVTNLFTFPFITVLVLDTINSIDGDGPLTFELITEKNISRAITEKVALKYGAYKYGALEYRPQGIFTSALFEATKNKNNTKQDSLELIISINSVKDVLLSKGINNFKDEQIKDAIYNLNRGLREKKIPLKYGFKDHNTTIKVSQY